MVLAVFCRACSLGLFVDSLEFCGVGGRQSWICCLAGVGVLVAYGLR